jgi:hypothetical protein
MSRAVPARSAGATLGLLACLAVIAPAASAADFTWSAGNGHWGQDDSWSGGVAPSGTVGTLTFPAAACQANACPGTHNSISSLTAGTLAIAGVPFGAAPANGWQLGGNPLKLTSGISATSPDASHIATSTMPIVLGADNAWTVDRGRLTIPTVTGEHALAISLTNGGELELGGNIGPVAITGAGTVTAGSPSGAMSLNGANRRPVSVTGATLRSSIGAIGALTTHSATVVADMTVASANLDAGSTLSVPTPSQSSRTGGLRSDGAIHLGGAKLALGCTVPVHPPSEIVHAEGGVTGSFSNAPENSFFTCGNDRYFIKYVRAGDGRVTTITASRPTGQYVWRSGADGSGGAPTPRWSEHVNWESRIPPEPNQSIAALTFSSGRDGVVDVPGLSIGKLGLRGALTGNGFTLGAGGLAGPASSAATGSRGSSAATGSLGLPVTLGASQTWEVTAPMSSTGGLSGTGSDLRILAGRGPGSASDFVTMGGAVEVGALSLELLENPFAPSFGPLPPGAGTVQGAVRVRLDRGASLNTASGRPVSVKQLELHSGGAATGALTLTDTQVVLPQPLATKSVTMDGSGGGSRLVYPTSAPGAAWGVLSSSGSVDLGRDTGLLIDNTRRDADGLSYRCEPAPMGSTHTLVSGASVTGKLVLPPKSESNMMRDRCVPPVVDPIYTWYRIDYTPTAVTATVVFPGDPGGHGAPGTPKQTAAPLAGLGAPKGATLRNLLKKGRFTYKVVAPFPGTYKVVWSKARGAAGRSKARGAAGKKARKPVIVASGRKTAARAGQVKVVVKLTRAGRRTLKKARRSLKLKSTATFTPTRVAAGPTVGAPKATSRTTTFTLR